jgi:transporter family-2 protein
VFSATPARALALAGVAGAALAVQAHLNGQLGRDLGSAQVAAAANNGVALLIALGIALATGSIRRVRARPPWWCLCSGVFGAAYVLISTLSAPRVGIALLTIALVCGQTAGGLAADACGLSPAGRECVTWRRVLGVVVAVSAVGVGLSGGPGAANAAILALVVLGGVAVVVQQSLAGRVAVHTGEPAVAAIVNFAGGYVVLACFAGPAVALGDVDWSAPAVHWLGGFAGALFVFATVIAIPTLGVLRLALGIVAGQSIAALVIDVVLPVHGERVTTTTVIGVLLTCVAVAVAGRRGPSTPRPPRPSSSTRRASL